VNIGALNHFFTALLGQSCDVEFNYVHTGGGGPTNAALLGGHIDAALIAFGATVQYHEEGDITAIATFTESRFPGLPDVPTAAEQGYELFFPVEHVWYAPGGTPKDVVERLAAAIETAHEAEAVQEFYAARSIIPDILSGDDVRQHVETTFSDFTSVGAAIAAADGN